MVEVHTNRGDENEITIGKTANYDGEIIQELGNATWCDHHNKTDQARIEEEEETYSCLALWIMIRGHQARYCYPPFRRNPGSDTVWKRTLRGNASERRMGPS